MQRSPIIYKVPPVKMHIDENDDNNTAMRLPMACRYLAIAKI